MRRGFIAATRNDPIKSSNRFFPRSPAPPNSVDKELAKETASATEEIGRKIEAIHKNTSAAVGAIAQVSQIISQVNDISGTIAAAVEQQTATTNEIVRNVQDAAGGSAEITESISQVARIAEETQNGAQSTRSAAHELTEMAAHFQHLVQRFQI